MYGKRVQFLLIASGALLALSCGKAIEADSYAVVDDTQTGEPATADTATSDGADSVTADSGTADTTSVDTTDTATAASKDSATADSMTSDTTVDTADTATADSATADTADTGATDSTTADTADTGATDSATADTADTSATDSTTADTADTSATDSATADTADTDTTDSATGDTGTADSATGDTGTTDSATGDTGSTDSATADTGSTDSATGDTGTMDTADTGATDSATGDSGTMDTTDTGTVDTGGTDTGPQSCASPAECASGFCADGYCCDQACDGACEACNLPGNEGSCTIAVGQDPHDRCGACYECTVDGACAPVTEGDDPFDECPAQDASTCGLTGFCDGYGACAYWGAQTPCGDQSATACDDPDVCDGAGACADNFWQAGTPCTNPTAPYCAQNLACDASGGCAVWTDACVHGTCDWDQGTCVCEGYWTGAYCDSPCIVYVTPGGAGSQNGSSWENAYPADDLGEALIQASQRLANENATTCHVWLADGVYPAKDPLAIPSGVQVYGGFNVKFAPTMDQRDPDTYVTVLEGNRSAPVVTCTDCTASTRLDGVTVANGAGDPAAPEGGLTIRGGAPVIAQVVFASNTGAAGVVVTGDSAARFEGCVFAGNDGSAAGALYIAKASATVIDTVFGANSASEGAGAITCESGRLEATNIAVAGNVGAAAGALVVSDCTATLTNATIAYNHTEATDAPAVLVKSGELTATNAVVWANVDPGTTPVSVYSEGACAFSASHVGPDNLGTACDVDAWSETYPGFEGPLGELASDTVRSITVTTSAAYDATTHRTLVTATAESDIPVTPARTQFVLDEDNNRLWPVVLTEIGGAEARLVVPGAMTPLSKGSLVILDLRSDAELRGNADANSAPKTDLVGRDRDKRPDIGAYEGQ